MVFGPLPGGLSLTSPCHHATLYLPITVTPHTSPAFPTSRPPPRIWPNRRQSPPPANGAPPPRCLPTHCRPPLVYAPPPKLIYSSKTDFNRDRQTHFLPLQPLLFTNASTPTDNATPGGKLRSRREAMQNCNPSLLRCIPVRVEAT